jgi:ubiquinol-cytochrome c reductase cytochrome b subunit
MASNWREWVVDRFGLEPIKSKVLDRRVAKGRWYFGDGAALGLLLLTQVVTGGFMMLTYSPSPDAAYASVQYITHEQRTGWFIRGLHYWSAGLMVVMLFFHFLRQILHGGYKAPREGTWLIGVLLFWCVIAMAFTGYLLRWDERAIYAIRVSLHMFHNVPWIGQWLVIFIQGGPELGAMTLTRFYAVHVFFIPLLMFMLVGVHLYLVIHHGVTTVGERKQPVKTGEKQQEIYEQEKKDPELGETFYPGTAVRSGGMAFAVFAVAVLLALWLGPRELDPEASLVTVAEPAEEWWFWWYSGLIALLPPWVAPWFYVVFPLLLFVGMLLLPFVDRSPRRGFRNRPIWTIVALLTVVALVYLSDYRRRSPFTGWPVDEPPPVPAEMMLEPDAERGRILFAQFGCNTCHSVAGHGRQVAIDLARTERRLGREELRQYVLNPPEGIPMPSYARQIEAGVMSEEELERIVDFVLVVQAFPRR